MATLDELALQKIEEFASDGSTTGVWRAIRKEELVLDLRERIRNKDGLNQQGTGLCGPASLIHTQLQDDPVSFVTLAVDLYKSGRASWRGQVITPNAELMNNPPPDGLIINGTAQRFNRADWIVMASARNTINPADHFNATSQAGTMFSDVLAFIRRSGYTRVEWSFYENSFSANEEDARRASALVQAGYRVLFSINAVMLNSRTQSDWGGELLWGIVPKPNHVVQLVSEIRIRPKGMEEIDYICKPGDGVFEGMNVCESVTPPLVTPFFDSDYVVNFEVYTWAQGHRHVPQDPNKSLSLHDLLWNFYGFIAFKN
jgi:hypothetical protein